MPVKKGFEDLIFVRGLGHRKATINAIAEKHRIDHVELARGLVEAACDFYDQHGFFSFPVRIEPLAFQRQWLAAEGQEPYAQAKVLEEAAREVLRGKDRADEAERKKRRAKPGATR